MQTWASCHLCQQTNIALIPKAVHLMRFFRFLHERGPFNEHRTCASACEHCVAPTIKAQSQALAMVSGQETVSSLHRLWLVNQSTMTKRKRHLPTTRSEHAIKKPGKTSNAFLERCDQIIETSESVGLGQFKAFLKQQRLDDTSSHRKGNSVPSN